MSFQGLSIRLVNCRRTFPNGSQALQGCDLQIAPGETIALLGPSGCGKTTLLRIIAGLDFPDEGGRVYFDEIDVTSLPVERRGVGMVFQSYALFPNMNVEENIGYGLRVRGVIRAERERRITEMLRMMRIDDLRCRRIDELSGGQRQRVALARAIAAQPRVLLLDEPLTALDARLRDELRIEIDQLLRLLRVTAVYVTHDQAEAMSLADRVAVMSRGRIEQIGTPREIYEKPATSFVTDFIGTMNRLSGLVRHGMMELGSERIPFAGSAGPSCLLFRPEDVRLVSDHDARLRATVKSVFYLGDHLRLTLETADGQLFIAKASPLEMIELGQRIGCVITGGRLHAIESPQDNR